MKIIIALIRPRERIRLTIEAGEGNIRRARSIVASTTIAKVMEAAVTSVSTVAVSATMIVSAVVVSTAMIISVVAVSKVETVAAAVAPHGAITGVMARKEASASRSRVAPQSKKRSVLKVLSWKVRSRKESQLRSWESIRLLRVERCPRMQSSFASIATGSGGASAMDGDAPMEVFDTKLIWCGH